MTTRSSENIEVVTSLRGVAAAGVMLWHFSIYLGPFGEGIGGALFHSAWAMGVDLFFILSGFVMVVASRNFDGTQAYAIRFWIKRFARVWPVYAVATLAYFAIVHDEPGQTLTRLVGSLLFAPPSHSIYVWMDPTLVVGWSLVFEIFFYTLFSFSMLFGRHRWLAFWSCIAIFQIFLPMAFGTIGEATGSGYMVLITHPLTLLFAEGVLIGLVFSSTLRLPGRFWAQILVTGAIGLAAWQYASQFRALTHGIEYAGLTLAPLVLVLTLASKTMRLNGGALLTHLGTISFSLYLMHCVVMAIYGRVAPLIGIGGGWSTIVLLTAFSIVLASISHRYLELGLSNYVRTVMLTRFDALWIRSKKGVATA